MDHSDEQLFTWLSRDTERRVSEFNTQGLTNMAWAFATVHLSDKKLFAVLAREAERLLSEFTSLGLANTAWAFATVN